MADTPSPVLALVSRQRAERSKVSSNVVATHKQRACVRAAEGGGERALNKQSMARNATITFPTLACLVLLISVARHLCTWVEGDSLQNSKCTYTYPSTYMPFL